jgi:hypothetical protein
LAGTAINKVPDKYGCAIRVAKRPHGEAVAKVAQQGMQLVRLPVNISNNVNGHSASL